MKMNLKYNRKLYASNVNIVALCEEWYVMFHECLDAQLYTAAKMYKDDLSNFVCTKYMEYIEDEAFQNRVKL
jgi:hypothetical protein